jgi:hypothetical protein
MAACIPVDSDPSDIPSSDRSKTHTHGALVGKSIDYERSAHLQSEAQDGCPLEVRQEIAEIMKIGFWDPLM